jgi:uncharacterized protein (TIGR02996 family)
VTETELLVAIAESPDEDGPRLVYADWLTERGDPRGELISLEVEQARHHVQSPDYARLSEAIIVAAARVTERKVARTAVKRVRGIVEKAATLSFPHLDNNAAELFEVFPLLHDVAIGDLSRGETQLLLVRPWRGRISTLRLFRGAAVLLLERLGELPRLRALHLNRTRLGELATLGRLSEVRLVGVDLTDDDVRRAVAQGCFASARSLHLDGNPLGDGVCDAVGRLAGLERLNLSRTRIAHAGVAALARLPRLVELDLTGCAVGREGCIALADARPPLQVLRLGRSRIRQADALRVAKALAGTLQVLDVSHNGISAGPLEELLGDRVIA